MNKDLILAEIRRTARNGIALGRDAFSKETGIRESQWFGKFWARWGDAVKEAGLESQTMQEAHSEELVFDKILALTKKLGRFPTLPEMALERRSDLSFPNLRSITRRYNRSLLFQKLIEYASQDERWKDLQPEITKAKPQPEVEDDQPTRVPVDYGHVYLIKSGKVYKIGSSRAVYNRVATVVRQAPFGGELLHTISTDDPEGIERYWHDRFSTSRVNGNNKSAGEWFTLCADDVAAFKRRKTM